MSRNRYVAVLGAIACLCLGLTLIVLVTSALFYGQTGEQLLATATSPVAIVGVVFGALWLVVKAVTFHLDTADRASR